MIQLQSIALQRGSRFLLEGANLTVNPKQKLGIIGANGSGKSSLFKLLLGELHEDAGTCSVPKQWALAHMAQEVDHSERSALAHVLDGDSELRYLEAEMRAASGDRLALLYERFECIDGYTAIARAQTLLAGLGFKRGDDARATHDFSGGWRIRLNLARALMCRSDLLLLDEPTNHLDLDACMWLESWLTSYEGTLLIISHDRDFLDNVVGGIVHLDQQKLTVYTGNYSAFEVQRAERLAQQSQAFDKQQQRVAEIEDFVRRFRAKATKAKQAQSRLKELERMEKIAPTHVDSPFSFRFPAAAKLPQTLLTFDRAALGYDNAIINKLELSILGSSRVGLLGHNGAGKSTLIKAMANASSLLSGERIESAHLHIGYYSQHQLETLDFQASAALHILRITPKASEQAIRKFLGSFGFHGDRAFEEIAHFSGGEKARLALALLAWQKPNLLLLDEPTNHLDLEVRHALTLALQAYEGAVVLVSHDRHLLRNTVDSFLLVDAGGVREFDGDLQDYEHWLAKERAQDSADDHTGSKDAPSGDPSPKADKKRERQDAAVKRAQLKPLSSAIKKLERTIADLQERLDAVEHILADSNMYQAENKDKLTDNLLKQASIKSELDAAEEAWLLKSEELEGMQ